MTKRKPKPDSRKVIAKTKGGAAKQSQYRVEYDAIAERLVRFTGATITEIAEVLGVSNVTLYKWQARHPSFRKALLIDLAVANHRVEVSSYQEAIGYWTEETETRQIEGGKELITKRKVWNRPSPTMVIWWQKCKAGWAPPEFTPDPPPLPDDGKTITPDGEADRQFARRIALIASNNRAN